jgi:hypothetical protein
VRYAEALANEPDMRYMKANVRTIEKIAMRIIEATTRMKKFGMRNAEKAGVPHNI